MNSAGSAPKGLRPSGIQILIRTYKVRVMAYPLDQPAFIELIERIAECLRNDELFVPENRFSIFVCGGGDRRKHDRFKFVAFSEEKHPDIQFVLAENVFAELVHVTARFHNLAMVEELIAATSDCILIFPESPGSFVEFGYFAANTEIVQNTLIAAKSKHTAENSFISQGPLGIYNRDSSYQPHVSYGEKVGPGVAARIMRKISGVRHVRARRERIEISDISNADYREKLSLLYFMSMCTIVINADIANYILNVAFGRKLDKEEVLLLLSILKSYDIVRRSKDTKKYLFFNQDSIPIVEIDKKRMLSISAEFIDRYRREYPKIFGYWEALNEIS